MAECAWVVDEGRIQLSVVASPSRVSLIEGGKPKSTLHLCVPLFSGGCLSSDRVAIFGFTMPRELQGKRRWQSCV